MNILFISFEYPPYSGGVGEYTFQISSRLHNAHKCAVTVLASKNHISNKSIIEFDKEQNYNIIRFYELPFKSCKLFYYPINFLYRLLKSIEVFVLYQPDIIFACDKISTRIAFLINKIFGIKYVVMGHGSEFLKFSKIYHLALKNSKCIILNSNLTKYYLQKKFNIPDENLNVIPLGADEKIYNLDILGLTNESDDLRIKLGAYDKKIILTVGTISHRKGQDLIINALPRIIQNIGDNVIYVMAGRTKDKNIYKLVNKLNVQDYVVITGFFDKKSLPFLYYLADVYVQPSRISESINELEGFSISACEALMMRKPVIVTTDTGIKDLIEDHQTGFIVESNNSEQLANLITQVIQQPGMAELVSAQGQMMALTQLNWKETARLTFSLLEKFTKTK